MPSCEVVGSSGTAPSPKEESGYRIYLCADGRVLVAALEPHFAAGLREMTGVLTTDMFAPSVREEIALWFATATRAQLDSIASEFDLPMTRGQLSRSGWPRVSGAATGCVFPPSAAAVA